MITKRFGFALTAATAIALAACSKAETDPATNDVVIDNEMAMESTAPVMVGGAEMLPSKTIVENASQSADFTTLVAAVEAAGLVETLSGPGPFTVFAPTDEAFATALESLGLTAEELLADTATLTSILTYHVVSGEVPSSDVVTMDGQMVPTVNGAELLIGVDGDTVTVNEATVTAVDIPA